MIDFFRSDSEVVLSYSPEFGSDDWVTKKIKEVGSLVLKKTFAFSEKHLRPTIEEHLEDNLDIGESPVFNFSFAFKTKDYFKVYKGILTNEFDIYFHKEIELTIDFFVADSKISIFRLVEAVYKQDIYIGGENKNAIPYHAFIDLIKRIPNTYEKTKYVEARISSILKNYMDNVKDAETGFLKYMNKKASIVGADLFSNLAENEIVKYEAILRKLKMMLENEQPYSERQWQKEILDIILLLYPKYIQVFTEVPISTQTTDNLKDKFLDFLLVDCSGNIDIIEIKKPSDNAILTHSLYRGNYIPLRELSGTVMQIEKYIYYLNRWSIKGEKYLTQKYQTFLPSGLSIKITNPGGMIIMGRDNQLNDEQKMDFEVVKRKYKNVVDIITYDDLIKRLEFILSKFKPLPDEQF